MNLRLCVASDTNDTLESQGGFEGYMDPRRKSWVLRAITSRRHPPLPDQLSLMQAFSVVPAYPHCSLKLLQHHLRQILNQHDSARIVSVITYDSFSQK